MPRRSILSAAERESLLALPDTKDELIRHYTFSESDLSIIRQRRGPANRLGTVAKLAMRQPFVLFKGLTFQKLCLPGAFRPGDHHNKMLRPG
ncbi:DUF4158 domain-containing protein, partial [Enterobacter hormaechei subsp. hoffmannii]|nr:DUF4158 domain-containing protein [Enterobacter hormaechei subsp. hoffmannii]MCU4106803.1 DUF4158 domain-containing protein [Enterobacter hormaechei subsp. hoffmannii]